MRPLPLEREVAFNINDVARLLRTYADQRASEFGVTRAQWAVLARVELFEGLKQSELAESLDIQPITLTRLVDRLDESGLIERRPDVQDRRAKRLFLTPAARPLLDQLDGLGRDMMSVVLKSTDRKAQEAMLELLGVMKGNLREAIQRRPASQEERKQGERKYG